jgi:hypothetical protein
MMGFLSALLFSGLLGFVSSEDEEVRKSSKRIKESLSIS